MCLLLRKIGFVAGDIILMDTIQVLERLRAYQLETIVVVKANHFVKLCSESF